MESYPKHGNRWKKEKGLTLIETVIALSIITIVSLAVVSIIVYSSNALNDSRVKSFFSRETDSIASFYLSYNSPTYLDAVESLTGNTITGANTDKVYYKADYTYSNSSDYNYYISFNYDGDTLTLTSYEANSKVILRRSVTK